MRGRGQPGPGEHLPEQATVLGQVDRARLRPDDRDIGRGQRRGDTQRGLATELDDHADQRPGLLLGVDDLQDVLDGERFDVEPVSGVVVGGDRLRIAVDHNRLVAGVRQRHHRVATGVVELDALPDPVGPAAQHDHPWPVAGGDLGLAVIGRVVIRRGRGELGRAGVDGLVDRPDTGAVARRADRVLGGGEQVGELGVGKPRPLGPRDVGRRDVGQVTGDGRGDPVEVVDLFHEPGIDAGHLGHPQPVRAGPQGLLHRAQPSVVRDAGPLQQLLGSPRIAGEREHRRRLLQRTQCLLQRLGEAAPHPHGLTDGLHRRGQRRVRPRELLEGEPRHLDHDVVQRRFEGGRRGAGDVVGDLVQGVSERELRGDLRDREPGGLRRQRRRPGYPGVHLDHDEPPGRRIHGELDVAPTRVDAHRAHDRDGHVPHLLVFAVGQRHRRGDRHRVAGVHTHRVDVLDRADHDHVVGPVPHQLELELLPAEHGLLDQDLRRGAGGNAVRGHPAQLVGVVRETAAGAAEGEARAYHHRVGELLGGGQALLGCRADGAAGGLAADGGHDVLERLPVLARADRVDVRTDQADTVAVEDARIVQIHGGVQRSLPAHGRQQRVRTLPINDLGDHLQGDRLDVGGVREVGIGHDRCRVAVDQHHPQTLGAQHPTRLRPGIVELAGLTDDDRS